MTISEKLNEAYLQQGVSERAGREWKLGPSNMGDCERKLAFMLSGWVPVTTQAPETVRVFEWGTQRGARLEAVSQGIWPDCRTQVPVQLQIGDDAIVGTADLWIPSLKTVVDYKTVGAFGAGLLEKEGPSEDYQLQVHAYRAGIALAEGLDPREIRACLVYEVKDSDARRGVKAGALIELEVPWTGELEGRFQLRLVSLARMLTLKSVGQLDPTQFPGLPKTHWKCRNGADGVPLYCPVGSKAGRCHEIKP